MFTPEDIKKVQDKVANRYTKSTFKISGDLLKVIGYTLMASPLIMLVIGFFTFIAK